MNNKRNWWVGLVQGIIALVLGLILIFGGNRAAETFGMLAALYILFAGLIELYRSSRSSMSFYRAVIGIVIGALLLLLAVFDAVGFHTFYTLFAIGVIIVGALGLFVSLFSRGGRPFSWAPVITNGLLLLWGALIFIARMQGFELQLISGLILSAIGAVIAIWAYVTRNKVETNVAV